MNVAYFGYREWAIQIFQNLKKYRTWRITDISEADVILYYGWSKMIPAKIYKKKLCLILHPSLLPKYRGGSPLQHQIINGEKKSAVTICRVTDKLDAGHIYSQSPFSLHGSLDDIFARIVDIGIRDTIKVLKGIENGTLMPKVQDDKKATVYKRRKPQESELTSHDFEYWTSKELHNFIRALNDPYPNAFIKCKDGKKLYITGSHL